MAAPTPVSAYLHAASMVKAGIILVAFLAPGFSTVPGWSPVLLTLGTLTMLVGGWRALRQIEKAETVHGGRIAASARVAAGWSRTCRSTETWRTPRRGPPWPTCPIG